MGISKVIDKTVETISELENNLTNLWKRFKPYQSIHYVITLDRIVNSGDAGLNMIRRILNHKGLSQQIEEWRRCGIISEEMFDFNSIFVENNGLETISPKFKFLPIDTAYFYDIENDIVNLFSNLDEALDGWLIKSDNWQALNMILPTFREKIQGIYIDPPFNNNQESDYYYNVKYMNFVWTTMLRDRISLARELLKESGSIFVRCDYKGNWIVRSLLDEIFGKDNFRNEIAITRTKTALYITTPSKLNKNLGPSYDNIYWYSKTESTRYSKISEGIITIKRKAYWKDLKSFYNRPYNRYELLGILPEPGCSWVWKKEEALKAFKNYEEFLEVSKNTNESLEDYWERKGKKLKFIKKENNTVKYWIEPEQRLSISDWTYIEGYSREWGFPTENSERLIKIIVELASSENDLIMDFFLGSGTTIAVAHKLRRKWIGIEVGEHFYSVILSRMKKVLAYDKSGISKEKDVREKYNARMAGGFFRYCELTPYSDIFGDTYNL